jgi:hypothetical protein
MPVPVIPLEIVQGATFRRTINWYGGGLICHAIESVEIGCPTVITVTNHGLPTISTTPVHIDGVKGATGLNTGKKTTQATFVAASTLSVKLPTLNQVYVAGTGVISYYSPTDLTDYDARMQIRSTVGSDTVRHELTKDGGDITLTVEDGGIHLHIAATDTAAFTFDNAVYDLELIDSAGDVTRVAKGTITLDKETTR